MIEASPFDPEKPDLSEVRTLSDVLEVLESLSGPNTDPARAHYLADRLLIHSIHLLARQSVPATAMAAKIEDAWEEVYKWYE